MNNLVKIKTSKFKNITLSLRFTRPFEVKKRVELALLGQFIGKYSKQYPDKEAMAKAQDMLYDMKAKTSIKVHGDLLTMDLTFNFINPAYIKDLSSQDFIAFIDECISNPLINEKLFNEIKGNFIDNTKRHLDNPRNRETSDLIREIAKDAKDFIGYDKNVAEIIEQIELEDVLNTWDKLFKESALMVFLMGNYDDELLNYLEKFASDRHLYQSDKVINVSKRDEIIKEIDGSQSYLSMVYSSPYNRSHEDYVPFLIADMVLGGSPLSLLFSEVRERQGLCYFIDTVGYRQEGLLRVVTGIDASNFSKTKEAIVKQLERLQKGDFDESIVEASKRLIINSLLALSDNPEDCLNYIFLNHVSLYPLEMDDYIAKVKLVSKEDVIRVAQNIKPYLCHFYKGVKHD